MNADDSIKLWVPFWSVSAVCWQQFILYQKNRTQYFKHLCLQSSWLCNSTTGGPGVAIRASCRFSHSEDMRFRSVRPNPAFNCRLTPSDSVLSNRLTRQGPDQFATCCDAVTLLHVHLNLHSLIRNVKNLLSTGIRHWSVSSRLDHWNWSVLK